MLIVAKKNIETGQICRNETFDGKEFLVFPVVMMVEGVHINNAGPTYYPSSQLSSIPEAWNMKPVVVLHPEEDGAPVSACSKEVVEKQSVGVLLNSVFEDGKLKAEAWIDVAKAEKVYPGLIANLRSGNLMEVSIGHFSEDKEESGIWNGEKYIREVTLIKPDHLALLPNQVGACSVADGAGIPRINRSFDFRSNEVSSHEQIYSLLHDNLVKTTPNGKSRGIEAIYDSEFIYYEFDYNTGGAEELYLCSYSIIDGKAELGTAKKVRRLVEYVQVNKETKNMDEKLLALLTNAGFSEEALTAFNGLPEEQLKVLSKLFENKKPEEPAKALEGVTVNEYLSMIPDQFREVLSDGVRLLTNKRAEQISVILGNKKNMFSKEELEGMPMHQLEKLCILAKTDDYTVAGSIAANRGHSVGSVEPLPEPAFNLNMKGE